MCVYVCGRGMGSQNIGGLHNLLIKEEVDTFTVLIKYLLRIPKRQQQNKQN